MNTLEKFNSEKLNPAEMEQVHGGGLDDNLIKILKGVNGQVQGVVDLTENIVGKVL